MALSLSKRTTLDLLAINFFNVNSRNRSNTTPSGVARPAKNKLAGSAYEISAWGKIRSLAFVGWSAL
jgi:hypothetical protein